MRQVRPVGEFVQRHLEMGKTEDTEKIMVLRGGAVGDFIVTLPVLAALRRRHPSTRLEVVCNAAMVPLATASGLAEAAWPLDTRVMSGFFARGTELDKQMCSVFADSSTVICFLSDKDGVLRENVSRCGTGGWVKGISTIDETSEFHASRQLLDSIGETQPAIDLRLGITPGMNGEGEWLAIHPGSGSEKKNWPIEFWRELLGEFLMNQNIRLLIVCGEADVQRVEALLPMIPDKRMKLVRNLPLDKLAGQIAGCKAYIGHDSGITHLAGVLGMPGAALWGPTNAKVWEPLGGNLRVLHDARAKDLLSVLRDCGVELS